MAQWREDQSGLQAELGAICWRQGSTFGREEQAFLGATWG